MQSTTSPRAAAGPSRRARACALIACSLGYGVVQLDVSVVNVAIRPIGTDLGGSVTGLQWIVDAYTVAFAALILSAGALGDRIGAKRVFSAGFVVFTLASAACGLAPNLGALISARAVQGVGAAVLVPCSLTLLNHAYPDARGRARAVGLWAAGASVALSGGPLVGGVLIAASDWRAIFFINLPIGAVAIWLTARFATETTRAPERGIDVPGQLTAIVALVAGAGATVEGGKRGFADGFVLGGYVVGAAAIAAFVLIESRRAEPMLPLGLFRSRSFSAVSAIGLLINIAFYGLIFVLSLYFQDVHHYSPLRTGLAFAPATAVVLLANVGAGRLTQRWGTRPVLVGAAVVLAASLAGLLVVGDQTPYVAVVGQLMAVCAAIGLIVPAMTTALLGSVDRSRSGVAAGTLNTARQAGSVVGVALFGSLLGSDVVSGLRLSLLIGVGLVVLVGVSGAMVSD